jgi:hypothetical protein
MTSWYELLKDTMLEDGEDFNRRVCTLDEEALKRSLTTATAFQTARRSRRGARSGCISLFARTALNGLDMRPTSHATSRWSINAAEQKRVVLCGMCFYYFHIGDPDVAKAVSTR